MNQESLIETSWKIKLAKEFEQSYMQNLTEFLQREIALGKSVLPQPSEYYLALNLTPFSQVKVVILGQDPYHGPNQAHGLSFSVKAGTRIPPSLNNIYKELSQDLNIAPAKQGSLASWAAQGVLLLNSVLTVEQSLAASHQNQGWEKLTDRVIQILNEQRDHLVFVLWGALAQAKGRYIDRQRHLVLESAHPSPLSAYRGFFGSKPFSKINHYLVTNNQVPIEWQLQN